MSNARIFQEMRSADAMKNDMKQNILEKAYEKAGKAYEKGQGLVQESGVIGALNDIYRRVFENGWFGKDVFDGRLHWDNQAAKGQGSDNSTIHGKHTDQGRDGQERGSDARQKLGQGYDQKAEFYGWDKGQQQDKGQERDRGREDDLER
jgi:hypothetical protein